jgi:hypothetical protein
VGLLTHIVAFQGVPGKKATMGIGRDNVKILLAGFHSPASYHYEECRTQDRN